jgi:hypothetical protein
MSRTCLAALVVVAAACGGSQKDIAVKGEDSELIAIAGDWVGEYQGRDSGRSGPVRFSLQLGRHVAEGEVFMGGETPLKIQFIEVDGRQLKGTIAPYTDPNCSCEVSTSFLGTRTNDEVSGTFETKVKDTIQTGTWKVARKK